MQTAPLHIKMLGEFSIQYGPEQIRNSTDRSRKIWLLIGYLIYYRKTTVSPEEMMKLLWGEEIRSTNPVNALKTMLHRARALLNRLEDGIGYELIVRRDLTYAWNTEIPITLDIDDFTRLCETAGKTKDDEKRLGYLMEAAGMYQGDFMAKLAANPWVTLIASHFHSLYLEVVAELLPMLEARERWADVADVCRNALAQEPCTEDFCRRLMEALLHLGDKQGAAAAFNEMSDRLLSEMGVLPSDELRALYRTAVHATSSRRLTPSALMQKLEEPAAGGALLCDYDFFRTIYHCIARMVERSGDAVHLALITLVDAEGNDLSKRSRNCAMDNLEEMICLQLRRGDVATRCSASQFVLLLPQANYEDSRMVCRRIEKAFFRQYPHSPAVLQISVQPLVPSASK